MALPLKFASLEEIPESLREHYLQNDTGEFEITIDVAQPLRNAFAMEKQHRRHSQARVKELEAHILNLSLNQKETARPAPEIESSPRSDFFRLNAHRLDGLEGSTRQAMIDTIVDEAQSFIEAEVSAHRDGMEKQVSDLRSSVRTHTTRNAAQKFINEIARDSNCAMLLMPQVLPRFDCEQIGDDWSVFIKDVDGNRSSLTIAALRDEFRSIPTYARLVKGPNDFEQAEHQRLTRALLGDDASKVH